MELVGDEGAGYPGPVARNLLRQRHTWPMSPLRYVPYDEAAQVPNVVVDGSPNAATVLTLTHWPGIAPPAGLADDLSAQMASGTSTPAATWRRRCRRGTRSPWRIVAEPPGIDELLAEVRAALPHRVRPDELGGVLARGGLVVDIRPAASRAAEGDLPGAVVIDRNVLEWRLDPASPHRIPEVTGHDHEIVLVCNEGYATSLAAATLQRLGLHRATDLDGGYRAWRAAQADPAHER